MDTRIRRLDELVSPQLGVYGRMPQLSEEDYIEGLAEELPALEESEYNRRMMEERIALDKEARREAEKDASIAKGLGVADLGVKAYPYLSKLAAGKTATGVASGVTQAAVDTGVGASIVPGTTTAVSGATEAGVGSKLVNAGGGFLASMAPSAVGYFAGKAGGTRSTREIGKLGGMVKGKTAREMVGGGIKGAVAGMTTGAAIGAMGGPIGVVGGGIYGLLSGIAGGTGKCIIITICTEENSEDVKVAREYRDKFMDKEMLRGYYMIADKIVPILEKSKLMRTIIRHILVKPMIAFGRKELGYSKSAGIIPEIVTGLFLFLCHWIGSRRSEFVRINGEVI